MALNKQDQALQIPEIEKNINHPKHWYLKIETNKDTLTELWN